MERLPDRATRLEIDTDSASSSDRGMGFAHLSREAYDRVGLREETEA